MSLLIDALKQAEASRRQTEQPNDAATPPSGNLALEPLTNAEHAAAITHAAATIPHTAARMPAATTPSRAAHVQAARELFEVKQKTSNRAPWIIAIIGLSFLAAGGGYLWWAIHPRGLETGPALASGETQPMLGVGSVVAASSPVAIAPSGNDAVAESGNVATNAKIEAGSVSSPVRIVRRDRETRTNQAPASQTPTQDSANLPAVRHSEPAPSGESSPAQHAYDAWQAGDLVQARSRYREILQQQPRNIDALDALGMIALRTHQTDVAERYFRDALVVDPKDATAVSQLTLLYADGDAAAAESRLRSLLAGQPDSGVAYFALGNLQAKQGRWGEAQQSFFQAYTLDGGNPDVLYNLAISLDHLGQSKPAQQYYERAIRAAALRPASFDPAAARVRAQALANANTTR